MRLAALLLLRNEPDLDVSLHSFLLLGLVCRACCITKGSSALNLSFLQSPWVSPGTWLAWWLDGGQDNDSIPAPKSPTSSGHFLKQGKIGALGLSQGSPQAKQNANYKDTPTKPSSRHQTITTALPRMEERTSSMARRRRPNATLMPTAYKTIGTPRRLTQKGSGISHFGIQTLLLQTLLTGQNSSQSF